MTTETPPAATVHVALPAYNEEANLSKLLGRWEQVLASIGQPHRFVIVDDGSKDATPDILREWAERIPLHVVTHEVNQGLGATIRDALRTAAEGAAPDDVVVTMDADNTHPPELVPCMLERMRDKGADVVIASRYRKGSRVVGLSRWREFMSFGARLVYKTIFPIHHVRDYTCGYRAYRASCLQRAFDVYGDSFVELDGFESMADILLKLSTLGLHFEEVPFVLRYDLKGGESKMRVGQTALRSVKLVLKRRFQLRKVK